MKGTGGTAPVIKRDTAYFHAQFLAPARDLDRTMRHLSDWPELSSTLLQEFIRVSQAPGALDDEMARSLGAQLIGASDLAALANEGWFWSAFFRRFPSATALVSLSPVAFDTTAGEALGVLQSTDERTRRTRVPSSS